MARFRRNPLSPTDVETQLLAVPTPSDAARRNVQSLLTVQGPIEDSVALALVQNLWRALSDIKAGRLSLETLLSSGSAFSPGKPPPNPDDVNAIIQEWNPGPTDSFFLLGITHNADGEQIPVAARLAMKQGLPRLGIYIACAVESGVVLDLFTTQDGIIRLLKAENNPGLRRTIVSELDLERRMQAAADAEDSDEEGSAQLASLRSVLLRAYRELNTTFENLFNLVTSTTTVSYPDIADALEKYHQQRARYLTFMSEVIRPRAGNLWEELNTSMLRYDNKLRQQLQGIFGREAGNQRARRELLQKATSSVLMTTGLPVTDIPASSTNNFVTYRHAQANLEARLRTQPKSAGGGVQFLGVRGPRIAAPTASPAVYEAAHSPYWSNVALTVPAAWLGTAPFLDESTVLRFSPDLSYLIVYRNRARVGGFSTRGAGLSELSQMLSTVLKIEQLWRNTANQAVRSRMPIYVVQAGTTVAYPVYSVGPRSRILEFSDAAIAKIVTGLRIAGTAEDPQIAFVGVRPQENIVSPAEAQAEKEAFEAEMTKYNLRPSFTPADTSWDEDEAEEGEAAPKAEGLPVVLTVTPYEEGDESEYTKIAAAILSPDVLPVVFVENPDAPFAKVLRTRATASQQSLVIKSTQGQNLTGVPRYVFLLSADPEENTRTLALEFRAGLKNSAPVFQVSTGDNSVSPIPSLQVAAKQILGEVGIANKGITVKVETPDIFEQLVERLKRVPEVKAQDMNYDQHGKNRSVLNVVVSWINAKIQKGEISDLNEFAQRLTPATNPWRSPRRNDGRQRRAAYVARTFQRITS